MGNNQRESKKILSGEMKAVLSIETFWLKTMMLIQGSDGGYGEKRTYFRKKLRVQVTTLNN